MRRRRKGGRGHLLLLRAIFILAPRPAATKATPSMASCTGICRAGPQRALVGRAAKATGTSVDKKNSVNRCSRFSSSPKEYSRVPRHGAVKECGRWGLLERVEGPWLWGGCVTEMEEKSVCTTKGCFSLFSHLAIFVSSRLH